MTGPGAAPSTRPKIIFLTEMWERFSYYGMRALLVLYLVKGLGYERADALELYGGYLADSYLGIRQGAVIGGYTVFYMGINLGAFFSPLVAGTLGERLGWHWGFACAGVGMAIGLFTPLRWNACSAAPACVPDRRA